MRPTKLLIIKLLVTSPLLLIGAAAALNFDNFLAHHGLDNVLVDGLPEPYRERVVSWWAEHAGPVWDYLSGPFGMGLAAGAGIALLPDLISYALALRRRWAAQAAMRRAASVLLARAKPHIFLVSGRLKYANQVCAGVKDAETFYKKISFQGADMRHIADWNDPDLTDEQQSALENLRIQCNELDSFLQYGMHNEAGFNYLHIAHMYRQRMRKVGRALNQLITELSGPGSAPELIPDALLVAEQPTSQEAETEATTAESYRTPSP